MSDRRLREFERLAARGDPQAAERLLRERIRTGDLQGARVRLLALLGDPVARDALGGEWPRAPLSDPDADPGEILAQLRPSANRGLIVRAVLGIAEFAVGVWEQQLAGDPLASDALSSAWSWWEAIERGEENDEHAARARERSTRLFEAALLVPRPADSAGRAASEPAATIEATGGRFLTSAETVARLTRTAGVSLDQIRDALLATIHRER